MDKILQKREIKKANSLNTLAEDIAIVDSFLNKVSCNNFMDKSNANSGTTTLPIVVCKDTIPVYLKAFQNMNDAFTRLESGSDNIQSLLSQFINAFENFDNEQQKLAGALIDFGEFVPAFSYSQLPMDFMLSHNEYATLDFMSNCKKSLHILEQVNSYLADAVSTADKSKCMALSPYITGCSYNIYHSIEVYNTKKNPEH